MHGNAFISRQMFIAKELQLKSYIYDVNVILDFWPRFASL